jgi:hypothetical protein
MKTVRVLTAGVVVTVFNTIVSAVTCGGVFNWVYKLEPTNVWRPMQGAPGAKFMFASLVLGIILAYVYALIQKGVPGGNKFMKGLVFGLCVWAVGTLPGMLVTHRFMIVARTFVIYWTIHALIKIPLDGLIIATIYGE